jgi:hypothetical protein
MGVISPFFYFENQQSPSVSFMQPTNPITHIASRALQITAIKGQAIYEATLTVVG